MKNVLLTSILLLQSLAQATEFKTNFLDEMYSKGKQYVGGCSVKSDLKIGAWITNFNAEYAGAYPGFMLSIDPAKNGSAMGSFPFTWLLFEGDNQNKIQNPHSSITVRIISQKPPVEGSEVEDGIRSNFVKYDFVAEVVDNKIKAVASDIDTVTGKKTEQWLAEVQVKSVNSRIEQLNKLKILNFSCKLY